MTMSWLSSLRRPIRNVTTPAVISPRRGYFPSSFFNPTVVLILLIVLYGVVLIWASFARLDTHKAYLADLGIYHQVIWSTLHGHFMHQSYSFTGQSFSRFFYHFDPILLLFVPLYAIIASPKWFLLVQTLAIALSVVPLYAIGRRHLGAWPALLLAFCYLIYFPLQNGNMYDFHEIGLAVPLIAILLWAVIEDRQRWFWGAAGFLLLVQEDMALVLAGMGLYLLLTRKYCQGALTLVGSLGLFFLLVKVVIPHFSHGAEHLMFKATAGYLPRYAWLGSSPEGVIRTILTRPFYVLSNIATKEVGQYLLGLFLPLIMLPLGSLLTLIALPTLAINILSQNQMMHHYYFYHSLVIAPILFVAAMMVLSRLRQRSRRWYQPAFLGVLALSIFYNLCCTVLPYGFNHLRYTWEDLRDRPVYHEIETIRAMISPTASVCTQENLGVFFSQRLYIYAFPVQASQCDYVVLSFNNPFYGEQSRFIFRSYMQRPETERKAIVSGLIRNHGYRIIYNRDGYLVLRKPMTPQINR